MMQMVFDSGLRTERTIKIDHITEHPLTQTINGTRTIEIKSENDWPDVSDFVDNPDFETIEIIDSNHMPLPIGDKYNIINDIAINYDDTRKIYSMSVLVGVADKEVE